MTLPRLTLAMLLLTLTAGCGSSSSPSTPSPTSGPTTNVSMVNGASLLTSTAYAPNPVNITVGTTVMWVNNDNTAHTSTADGGAWSSPSIAPGGQFTRTFSSAGTFTYHCTIHPNMIGTVNVQ
jgi:plastocyanin